MKTTKRSGFFLLTLTTLLWVLAACAAPPAPVPPTVQPSETGADESTTDADAPRDEVAAEGNIKTIFVGSERVECVGVAPQECYLVRESQDEEYSFFYDEIEGFSFEPGFEYELRVEAIEVEDPPADASSIRWVLVEEVSRTAVSDTPTATATTSNLENNIWVLNNLNGEPVSDVRVTLQLNAGQASGNGGCNSYSGSYTLDGTTLTFGDDIAMTMMACPDPAGSVEAAYLALLPQVTSYQLDNGTLTLLSAEGEALLTFTADQPASFTGVEWGVVGFNNGRQAVTSPLLDTEISLLFGADGRVSGNASCNQFNGNFTIDGQSISVGELATTRMMCPEEVMQQEAEFLAALQNATSFSQDGDLLTLFGENEERMLDLRPLADIQAEGASSPTDVTPVQPIVADVANPDFLLTNWVLGAYRGQPVRHVQATIQFTSDQFSGNGGCNTFFGSYTRDGQNLTIAENIGSTMMACAGSVMQFESTLLNTLPQVTNYRIENGLLHLLDENSTVLLTYYEDAPAPLVGTAWTVTAINNGLGGLQSVLADSVATMEFDAGEGRVFGNASCNQFNGPFSVEGERLSVGLLMSSMMLCEEETMQQEAAFLSALQGVDTFSIEGKNLTLFDEDGSRLIEAVGDTNPLADTAVSALPSIDLGQISLDTAVIGQQIGGELVPRLEYNMTDEGAVGHPAHLLFTANGEPFMRLFPIREYTAIWDAAGDPTVSQSVAQLEALLITRPQSLIGDAPILPPNFAYPDVIGAVRYFTFANDAGAGVRYIGRFVTEANPVTSDQLAYYYQGLTNDGAYYLSVALPISTESFPATLSDLTTDEIAAIFEAYDAHLAEATAVLNNLAPSDITPNLSDLDLLISTMSLTAAPEANTGNTAVLDAQPEAPQTETETETEAEEEE